MDVYRGDAPRELDYLALNLRDCMKTKPFTFALTALLFGTSFAQTNHIDRHGFSVHRTVVIGDDGGRTPGPVPENAQSDQYRAIGHVSCTDPTDPTMYASSGTGTLVENNRTVITAAHTFFRADGSLVTNLEQCAFYTVNNSGKIMTKTPLVDLMAVEDATEGNLGVNPLRMENDWAVIKLASPVPEVTPLRVSRTFDLKVNDVIKLCGFPHDDFVRRCQTGTYRDNGAHVENLRNPFVVSHDIDTRGGSSGSPIFSDTAPLLIRALHVRGGCDPDVTVYDKIRCSNLGIFFHPEFFENLDIIVEETGGSIYGPPKTQ